MRCTPPSCFLHILPHAGIFTHLCSQSGWGFRGEPREKQILPAVAREGYHGSLVPPTLHVLWKSALLTCHGVGPLTPTPRVSSTAFPGPGTAEEELGFKTSVVFSAALLLEQLPDLCLLPSPGLEHVLVRMGACVHAWVSLCMHTCGCVLTCVCLQSTSIRPGSPCCAPNGLSQWVLLNARPFQELVDTVSSSCWNIYLPLTLLG